MPGTEIAIVGRQADQAQAWREIARVRVPEPGIVSHTVVDAIDPGIERIPANLLRFSVAFSSVMDEGSAAGRVQLSDENGAVLAGALLEMPPELWDRDRRRLTVLVEPGRIKRGLQPHVQAGSPLREGAIVTLVVDAGIRDASGWPLVEGARRTYRVGPPIRSRVDPTHWEIIWPEAAADSLVVFFDRPLDRALVHRHLRVLDGDGNPAAGHTSLDESAQRWVFTPATDSHDLRLRVDARLEDLAGNSVRGVFDRDLERLEDAAIGGSEIILTPN